jgi:hypothetical protein
MLRNSDIHGRLQQRLVARRVPLVLKVL